MANEGIHRKLAAILSADVKGYSRLLGQDEVFTIRTLKAHREAIAGLVEQYKGRVIDAPGDNVLAAFGSVSGSVNCAVEIQRQLAERNAEVPSGRVMEWRIGIELGDVVEEEGKVYGDGVNTAARIEKLTDAGGIGVSGTVYDKVKNKLGLEFESLGEKQVKNIPDPVHVYRVLSHLRSAAHRVVEARTGVTRKWQRMSLAMAAVAVLCVGSVLVWTYTRGIEEPGVKATETKMVTVSAEKPSIAVLPFDNMSSDPEQEHFADAMTDEIISRLSKNSMLIVIARNSAFTYKGKAVKVQQVGQELGVKHVLEGSIQKAGNKVRIITQLVDAATGSHLWSETYERELKDIFAVQSEISQRIASALGSSYVRQELARVRRIPNRNLSAYESLWRGVDEFNSFTKEGLAKAREHFGAAIDMDANYADAYAWMAFALTQEYVFRINTDVQILDQAFDMAKKAQYLDSTLSFAHLAQSRIYSQKGQNELALAKAEKALTLDPNAPYAYNMIGMVYRNMGRYSEAIESYAKAIRLDPFLHYLHGNLSRSYLAAGQFGEAETAGKRAIDLYPDSPWALSRIAGSYIGRWITQRDGNHPVMDKALSMAKRRVAIDGTAFSHTELSNVHMWRKEHDNAISEAEKAIGINPGASDGYAILANILIHTGAYEESVGIAEKATELDPNSESAMDSLGGAYRLVGRLSDASAVYWKLLDQRPHYITKYGAHIGLAILYSRLGHEEKARGQAEELLRLVPHFSVEIWGERNPMQDRAQVERDMADLRKAGLK